MSSDETTVDETVSMTTTGRAGHASRAATVLGLLAVTQLTWIGGLVYGTIWLLT